MRLQKLCPPLLAPNAIFAVNWAQVRSKSGSPTFSARWGHATVVIGASQHEAESPNKIAKLILLGGDDYDLNRYENIFGVTKASETGASSGGFRNDVWSSESSMSRTSDALHGRGYHSYNLRGTKNMTKGIHLKSEMSWREINPGTNPPATWPISDMDGSGSVGKVPVTHDEWISCQDYFRSQYRKSEWTLCDDPTKPQTHWKKVNMWSPRRGHGAVVANKILYILGGMACEQTRVESAPLVGAMQDGQVEAQSENIKVQEQVILKNDIWMSEDGEGQSWKLVTPGCKDHQEDVLLEMWKWVHEGRYPGQRFGSVGKSCEKNTDCYGQAHCKALRDKDGARVSKDKICICQIFGAREEHAVTVQHRHYRHRETNQTMIRDYIYVIGGFTRVNLSLCGKHSCGHLNSGYRLALNDVWVSTDGFNWVQIRAINNEGTGFVGRGGHAAIVVHSSLSAVRSPAAADRLIILGGETSNVKDPNTTYLNDVWSINLEVEPCCVALATCGLLIDDPTTATPDNPCASNSKDWSHYNAEWSGRTGHSVVYELPSKPRTFDQHIYVMGGRNKEGVLSDVWSSNVKKRGPHWTKDFDGPSRQHGAFQNYLSVHSEVEALIRYRLPLPNSQGSMNQTAMTASSLLNKKDRETMKSLGIQSIGDLSDTDIVTMLMMRGIDHPMLEKRPVANVCYLKALADALIEKCDPKGAKERKRKLLDEISKTDPSNCTVKLTKTECFPDPWDGCRPIVSRKEVNIYGLGNVAVPLSEYEPERDLGDLHCRNLPKGRYMSTAVYFDGRVTNLGGRGQTLDTLYQDVWFRDNKFPQATISLKPRSYSAETRFEFNSNDSNVYHFEYKVLVGSSGKEMTPWLRTTLNEGADLSWLDWRSGGPGRGYYILYVRGIDMGGNRDVFFSGETNVYHWLYVPRPPYGKISIAVFCSLLSLSGIIFEKRRRERKDALERYALRQIRRKYKIRAKSTLPGKCDNQTKTTNRLDRQAQERKEGRPMQSRQQNRPPRQPKSNEHLIQEEDYILQYKRRRRSPSTRRQGVYRRTTPISLDHEGKLRSREQERRRKKQKRRRETIKKER